MSLREKCNLVDMEIELDEKCIRLPRERDKWLMQLLVKAEFDKDSLLRPNRVQVHQQVLSLPYVLGVSGKTIDRKVLRERKPGKIWSSLTFLEERPPKRDFLLCEVALRQTIRADRILSVWGQEIFF